MQTVVRELEVDTVDDAMGHEKPNRVLGPVCLREHSIHRLLRPVDPEFTTGLTAFELLDKPQRLIVTKREKRDSATVIDIANVFLDAAHISIKAHTFSRQGPWRPV